MLDFDPRTGSRLAITSSLFEPAYARPNLVNKVSNDEYPANTNSLPNAG